MNPIVSNLGMESHGPAVVNLQDALLTLLDLAVIFPDNPAYRSELARGLSNERSDATYGSVTQQLVSEFQRVRNVGADGIVDEKTAEALNKELLNRLGFGEVKNVIAELERYEIGKDIDVDSVLALYKQVYDQQQIWRMIEDIQRQAMLYANIIELVKQGKEAPDIRESFEHFGLMPANVLPNPHEIALVDRAFGKIAQYRRALIQIIRRYGGELLIELEFEAGLSIIVGVDVGFPPAVTIAVEHTTVARANVGQRPPPQLHAMQGTGQRQED